LVRIHKNHENLNKGKMMITEQSIKDALSKVTYPGFTKSIVEFGFVKDIAVEDKKVMIMLDITSSAPEVEAQLRDDIAKEFISLGVESAHITVNKPEAPKQQSNSVSGQNIAPQIKNFVMVSSGKGGVGKSTTSVNLAVALAMQGKKVGLLDADIYGPNIPRMMGLDGVEPNFEGNRIKPYVAYGVEVMSMGSLIEPGSAVVWRGAMIQKAIQQLLRDILWSELDVLVIDMPPGTGDAQLTLAQSVPVAAGINVTTPQHVALDDSRRSLQMFSKLDIPIAGIVENMSGFICPECSHESDIFGKGTCEELAKEYDTVVLANMPIEPAIREGGDGGKPVTYYNPDSQSAKRYMEAGKNLWEQLEKFNNEGKVGNDEIQTILPAGVSACSTEGQKIQAEHDAKKAEEANSGCCGGGHCS
jgi:ATP-binding protein involved in chromosome partitioning